VKIQFNDNGIHVFESSLYRTTSTVIELGQSILIVDPNWLPMEIDFILGYIDEKYPTHQQYLLFTHSDYDHILGYGAFPDAKVIASVTFYKCPIKADLIRLIKDFDSMYYIQRAYPIVFPEVDIIIDQDNQCLIIDQFECFFYLAPGHVADGLFMVIPQKNIWIAGDYLSNIEIPLVDHNFNDYQNTLLKVKEVFRKFDQINILIPGHGDLSTDRTEIYKRIKNDLNYLHLLNEYIITPDPNALEKLEKLTLQYSDNVELISANKKNIQQASMQ